MTALTILVVVFSLLFLVAVTQHVDEVRLNDGGPIRSAAPPSGDGLPAFVAPRNLGASCQYPKGDQPASSPVTPPRSCGTTWTPPR